MILLTGYEAEVNSMKICPVKLTYILFFAPPKIRTGRWLLSC